MLIKMSFSGGGGGGLNYGSMYILSVTVYELNDGGDQINSLEAKYSFLYFTHPERIKPPPC